MSLQVWLPLNGNLDNQGISSVNVTGTPTYANNGKIGKCLNSSATISVSMPSMAGKKVWSFCFWGYVTSSLITADWTKVAHLTDGSANLRVEVCPKANYSGQCCYSVHNNSGAVITSGAISGPVNGFYDQWAHFCLTSDGTTITKYINGVSVGTCSYNGTGTITGTLALLNNDKIKKNDVRVYDHCLSIKEIKELAKALILHYKLDNNGVVNENLIKGNYSVYSTSDGKHNVKGSAVSMLTASDILANKGKILTLSYDVSREGANGNTGGTTYQYVRYGLHGSTNYTVSGSSTATQAYPFSNYLEYQGTARVTMQWTIPSNITAVNSALTIACQPFAYPATSGVVWYIKNVKLEWGDKATPWCPNSNDAEYVTLGYSGNKETDCSGLGNHGIKTANITTKTDSPQYSSCYYFTTSDYINAGKGGKVTDEITVNFWASMDTWSNNQNLFSCTEGGGWAIQGSSSSSTLYTYVAGVGYSSYSFNMAELTSGWHMFSYTYDGFSQRLYIDGTLKGTGNNVQTTKKAIGYNASNAIFLHGEATSSDTTPATGFSACKMSDFRIYATALSADDIKELYSVKASIDNKGNLFCGEVVEE